MSHAPAELVDLIQRHALTFGDFTLASGAKSSHYIDCRKVTLSAAGAHAVAGAILDRVEPAEFDAIGGMTLGADPIIGAVLAECGRRGIDWAGLIVRKQAKGYGTGRQVEGPLRPGLRVLLVEDVTTTGGSALQAADALRAAGAEPTHVLTLLDRQAGAAAAFAAAGLPFTALATLDDLDLSGP